MLGKVIGVEARGVIRLDQPQPVLVMLAEREFAAVEMIENAERYTHRKPPVLPCRLATNRPGYAPSRRPVWRIAHQ